MGKRVVPLLCLFLLLFSGSVFAQAHRCVDPSEIVVSATNPAEIQEICNSAAQAITFLAQYNLHPKRTIRVEIVAEKIESHGYIAYGCYDS